MNSMKLKNYLIFVLLAFTAFQANAQCPFGTPDPNVWGSPADEDFGFTADNILNDVDTAVVTQGEDTSIIFQYLLPKALSITTPISGTATVTSVRVLGVSGLPIGISYRVDSIAELNNSTYFPQDYRYGAVTLCGTTFGTPGLYILTVTVNGCGSLSGISQCQNQDITLYLRVLPGSSSGVIAMTPPNGCEEADVDFEKNIPDPNPDLFTTEYSWDFAGLGTATGTTANFNFTAPGSYPITLTQTIFEYYISEISVNLISGWYPDIEELSAVQDPEPYLVVNAGASADLVGSNSGNPSGTSRTWTGLSIVFADTTVSFNAFDEDTRTPIVGSQDDDLGTALVSIIPTSTTPSGTYGFSSSNFIGTFKVAKRVLQTSEFKDTVVVYDLSTTTVSAPNGLEACAGDSVLLDAGAGFDYYQWYVDSLPILTDGNNQTFLAGSAGNYYVEVLEAGNICTGFSDTVEVINQPVSTPIIKIGDDGSYIYVDNPDTFQVQWYLDSVALPGEDGDTLETLGSAGPFTVSFTNSIGCTELSAPYEQCVGGVADPIATDTLYCECEDSLNEVYNVTSSGFALKPGNEIAWSITSTSDGLVESDAQVQAAADSNLVFTSKSDGSFDLEACNLTDLEVGSYYLTPFAVEALEVDTVYWTPDVDSNECFASFEICIGLSGSDWSIDPLTIELPNGDVIDVIDALAGGIVPAGTPITPTLWGLATSSLGDPACLDLIDIIGYYGNPNGTWKVNIPNSGTGDLNFEISPFNIVVDADSCPFISQDQVTPMPGISGVVAAGETRTFNIVVPPVPSGFPTLKPSCQAFGEPIEFFYKGKCIDTTSISVEEIMAEDAFRVYPNPNNGEFRVEFELMQPKQINLSLYNGTGQMIATESWNGLSGEYRKSYDLGNLPAGVYLLQLRTGDEQLTKKVIIQ